MASAISLYSMPSRFISEAERIPFLERETDISSDKSIACPDSAKFVFEKIPSSILEIPKWSISKAQGQSPYFVWFLYHLRRNNALKNGFL